MTNKLYVIDNKTESVIVNVNSIDEGLSLIRLFEDEDREEHIYEANRYDVVHRDQIDDEWFDDYE